MTAGAREARPAPEALAYCLLLSGAAALIYEVVWLRQISLVMGHTAHALSALLVAFLGGLALGSHLGGRLSARLGRGAFVKVYAGVELGVAVSALLVPTLVGALEPAYGAAYRGLAAQPDLHALAQLGLSCLALAAPCTLMGATLPLVAGALADDDRPAPRLVGRLYALNSLGGVVGAGLAGLLLLPRLGEQATTFVAVALNGLAAAFAILASLDDAPSAPSEPAPAPTTSSPRAWRAPGPRALVLLYALAGFSALTLQVGWARLVTLSIGSTVYGFTVTLVAFIGGLTLGSAAVGRIRALREDPARALFALHVAVGLSTLVGLPWLGALPEQVERLMGSDLGFVALWWAQLGLVFTTILVPTLGMGAIFPLITELLRREGRATGRAVGVAYAANTLGNILGAQLAGFVFLSAFGMRGTVVLSGLLSVGLALAYLRPAANRKPAFTTAAAGVAAALALALVAPGWDRDVVSSGPFLRGYQGARAEGREVPGELVDYVEGPTTVAAVRDRGTLKELYVGGVSEASSKSPMHLYLAHQAMLLHPNPKDVLLIGLGTGRTLGAIIQHPVESVDVLELSPEVVELAERHFSAGIALAFEDPRVHIRVQDGRSHLVHGARRYDVIVSQPSYPWSAGAARLFTREYFEALRGALTEDGVAVVWFPTRHPPSALSIRAAFAEAFPRRARFVPNDAYRFDLAVGFGPEGGVDPATIERRLSFPKVRRAAAGLRIRSARDLLAAERPWPPEDPSVPVNTDDNGFVEHAAFRALMDERRALP